MSKVYLSKSKPTLKDWENRMALLFPKFFRFDVAEERDREACADCPFYELFPTELLGQGTTWGYMWGGDMCHHPDHIDERDFENDRWLVCIGKRCNCPLAIQSWEDAWEKDYIEEIE